MGYNVGNVITDPAVGMDEDVPGGLTKWFEELDEPVPYTLGDEVPLTGKRHFIVLRNPNVPGELAGDFRLEDGTVIGEVARDGARQFVTPGNVWRSTDGSQYDVRKWNGIDVVATLSENATRRLLANQMNGGTYTSRPELEGEWQWADEMGSRHNMLVKEARRLAGTIRDEDMGVMVLGDWAMRHNLAGRHPETGRIVDDAEVREAFASALRKYDEDPAPITLLVPTIEAHQQQQEQHQQRLTWETLETLPYGATPSPLVLNQFIAPEGWTVLYANGGTGKGFLALWMLHQYLLANPDKRAMVLDYEGHQWEWGNRARNMGWSQSERERVIYIDPYDPVWKKGHTLAGLAPSLRPHADAEGVGLFIVDSYSTAAGTGSEMGGLEGAVDFFKAGSALGAPGLVLAHTSSEDRFPKRPFGSVFIHNLARETWSGAQLSVDTGLIVKGQFGVTETVMQVELRNMKRSVGQRVTAGQVFDIGFRSTGAITVDYMQTYQRPMRDLIADVLASSSAAMTAKGIAAAIKEDYDRDVDETTVRRTIERGIDGVIEVGTKRPKTYAASEQDEQDKGGL
jgi:hypothetical protein